MILATICVHGVRALTVSVKPIPRGIIGAKVQFEYADPMWDGLSKTVVFRAGYVTKDVLNAGEVVDIPPEVVAEVGEILKVGVYGEGVPTLWADLGRIHDATDPSGDETTDPTLPVWAQLQEQIDELRENGSPSGGGGKPGENGGYYTPSVKQPDSDTLQFSFAPSKADMPAIDPVQIELPAGPQGDSGKDYVLTDADKTEIAQIAAELVDVPEGSGGNVAYDEAQYLTDEQKAQARENIGAQPKGNYLTEVPEGYAKTEDVPTDAEIIQLIKDNAPEPSGGGIAVTGAKVGQTVKISAVDENGVPTAWESADFPSGGSGGERLVADGTKIATGTIPEGTPAWGGGGFGVTIGDLKKWKKFRIAVNLSSNSVFALQANKAYICNNTAGSGSKMFYDFEWLDTERTILGGHFTNGNAANNPSADTLVYANATGGFTNSAATMPLTFRILDDTYNELELKWVINGAQTADGVWSIFGILRYGEE